MLVFIAFKYSPIYLLTQDVDIKCYIGETEYVVDWLDSCYI